jgi:hypothetical protein
MNASGKARTFLSGNIVLSDIQHGYRLTRSPSIAASSVDRVFCRAVSCSSDEANWATFGDSRRGNEEANRAKPIRNEGDGLSSQKMCRWPGG